LKNAFDGVLEDLLVAGSSAAAVLQLGLELLEGLPMLLGLEKDASG